MLGMEALRAELDQMRLRGAPLHHGYHQPDPLISLAPGGMDQGMDDPLQPPNPVLLFQPAALGQRP